MTKTLTAIVLGVSLFVAASSVVKAEESTTTREEMNERRESRQEERKMVRGFKTELRCDLAEARIDTTTKFYDGTHRRHVEQYQKMVSNFKRLMASLKEKGYDVTKLEADAKLLNDKVAKFSQDHAAFIEQLKQARQYACGESSGQFKTEMQKARELAATLKLDAQDIRAFYQTVIRADIKAVRAQEPSN